MTKEINIAAKKYKHKSTGKIVTISRDENCWTLSVDDLSFSGSYLTVNFADFEELPDQPTKEIRKNRITPNRGMIEPIKFLSKNGLDDYVCFPDSKEYLVNCEKEEKSAQVGSEKVEEQEINFSAGGIFLADRGSHQVNFVTKEVQEAKEKLKELTQSFNRNPFTKEDGYFMKGVDSDRLLSLSWDIINALEEQKEDAILDRVFAKPEPEEPAISKKKTTENIWKTISELPAGGKYDVVIKAKNHSYLAYVDGHNKKTKQCNLTYLDGDKVDQNYVKSVCTLTDFVNQQEAIAKNQEIIFAEISKLKNK